ncbi:TMhelix containing protein [Vibrio phage 1.009.O._10N.261.51.C9]|nr:TMhelix containing protein [Vibrio phage 1.009.O._10N.261.51.C9]
MASFKVSTIFNAVDRMSRPIRTIQKRLRSFTRAGVRNMNQLKRSAQKATDTIKGIGQATIGAGATAAAALGLASRAGIEFEHTINRATAKMGDNVVKGTKPFNDLVAIAKQVGATTQFSATQAAQGLDFLAMAGFNADQSIAALPGTVDLATAAGIDLATATDIATDALGAFGLMTKDSAQLATNLTRVNDVLAKTSTSANTTIGGMFETIRKAAPTATAAGQSIETVASMIAVMANNGIKSEVAGTAVQNFFLRLAAPAGEAGKVLRRMGIQVADASGNMRDAFDIVGDLNKALSGMGEQRKLAIIQKIFGSEGLAGNLGVLNAGKDALVDFRTELEGSTGAATKLARRMEDDTMGSIKTLQSTIESVTIRFFELSGKAMRDTIDQTTVWIGKNREFIAQNMAGALTYIIDNLSTIVKTIKLIATTFAVLWAFNTIVKTLTGAMVLFNLVVAANPIVLMVGAAIIAIAGLAAAVYMHWEPIKTFFVDLWAGIGRGFETFASKLKDKFDAVFGPIRATIEWMLKKTEALLGSGSALTVVPAGQGFAVAGQAGGALQANQAPDIVTPEQRQAAVFREQIQRNIVELRINDPAGRVELDGKTETDDNVTITKTGGF